MLERNGKQIFGSLDLLTAISLLAFFSSTPFLLSNLDSLQQVFLSIMEGKEPFSDVVDMHFLWTMSIAVMFTALAVLFICLLKTGFANLSNRFILIGAVSYLGGFVLLIVTVFVSQSPILVAQGAGIPLGFGLAVLCMAWMKQVSVADFRSALLALALLMLAALLVSGLVLILSPAVSVVLLLVLACVGTFGCVWGFNRCDKGVRRRSVSGSNWWDVFGKLDASLVDGAKDIATPLSRVFFFVVAPAVVLLLFVLDVNSSSALFVGNFPLSVIGGLLAVAAAAPLFFIKAEHSMINVAYRVYLPLIAFVVFAVNSFVQSSLNGLIIQVGIYAFCSLYGLLMCSMLFTMASRMKSLALPTACLLLISVFLAAMLSHSRIDAGLLLAYQFEALIVLFIVAVVLLLVMPTSHMWRVLLGGVEAIEEAAAAPSLADRCEEISQTYGLSRRESETLQYLGRGHGSAYIADALYVAESTARSHVKSIYKKLGVSSREELLRLIDESDSSE